MVTEEGQTRFRSARTGSQSRIVGILVGLLVAAGLMVVTPARAPVARADAAGQGGDFVPLTPAGMLLDTRTGVGGVTGPVGPGSTTSFPVTGHGGVPASGIRAVLLNVETVHQTSASHLQLWPDGAPQPVTAMLDVSLSQTRENVAVVQVGANGRIDVYNFAGSADLIINVQGYFTTSAGGLGSGFVPVSNTRIVDTRIGLGAPKATIPGSGSLTVSVLTPPVPVTATAVFLNITVSGPSGGGWLSVSSAGESSNAGVIFYNPPATNTAAAVRPGPDGTVTFVNHGGASLNLILDVQGYFAATSAEGAGLRPVAVRLLNTHATQVRIAADATVDVQVGGVAGLPTRGIAGAALNFTVLDPEAGGYLRAWPLGDPEPVTTSLTSFPITGQNRDSMGIIKPGVDGKIRIHNISTGAIYLAVDLQGWFADPLPAVGLSQFAPTVAVQASPVAGASVGTIEYAYVDNIGRLLVGNQDPNALNSVTWSVISDLSQAFTGQPGLAEQSDGNMQVVGHSTDSNVSVDTETAKQPVPTWGPWAQVGGSMTSRPAIARLGDGRSVIFAIDADGQLWALPQDTLNGPYTAWQPLGDADLVGAPTVVPVGTAIQVFALDSAGAVKTASYDGSLSGWTSLGGTGLTGSPAAVVYPGLRLRVFIRAADGSVQTKIQDVSGAWPAAWDTISGFTAAGPPAAILDPVTGKTEVVARGTDSTIYHAEETIQGSGTWSIWIAEPQTIGNAETDPTVFPFTNDNGAGWALVTRDINNVNTVVPHQPGITPTAVTLPPPPA